MAPSLILSSMWAGMRYPKDTTTPTSKEEEEKWGGCQSFKEDLQGRVDVRGMGMRGHWHGKITAEVEISVQSIGHLFTR